MSDNDILKLLESYDSSEVGSEERKQLGAKIDDVGGKMKPSHVSRHINAYLQKKMSQAKERENNNE